MKSSSWARLVSYQTYFIVTGVVLPCQRASKRSFLSGARRLTRAEQFYRQRLLALRAFCSGWISTINSIWPRIKGFKVWEVRQFALTPLINCFSSSQAKLLTFTLDVSLFRMKKKESYFSFWPFYLKRHMNIRLYFKLFAKLLISKVNKNKTTCKIWAISKLTKTHVVWTCET